VPGGDGQVQEAGLGRLMAALQRGSVCKLKSLGRSFPPHFIYDLLADISTESYRVIDDVMKYGLQNGSKKASLKREQQS
jgi:hypothetical protein